MRDVFNAILNRHLPLIHEPHLLYFRDLYDHTVRIYELLETERERLSNALEVHLSHISNTLNQVMKRLTAVATIFMPLTFLTGFFGMNFEQLPFRESAGPAGRSAQHGAHPGRHVAVHAACTLVLAAPADRKKGSPLPGNFCYGMTHSPRASRLPPRWEHGGCPG